MISADSVSRGCGSARHVRRCIDITQATARALDPQARIRCAASAETKTQRDLLAKLKITHPKKIIEVTPASP